MQKLAGNFFVKRSAVVMGPGGDTMELYELPNGQWQFGKGRDAVVVTSLDQVSMVTDANILTAVAAWIERMKNRQAPDAVQQGHTPLLAGHTVKDRLSQAISVMSPEMMARMLDSIEKVMGPVADSLTQAPEVNSHSDGYGQDQGMAAPGETVASPFILPAGAKWVNPSNQGAGYLSPTGIADDKGLPIMGWHPSPDFDVADQRDSSSSLDTVPLQIHDPAAEEMAKDRASRAAQTGRSASSRTSRSQK